MLRPSFSRLRILVAENNEFNARHLERLLGRRGIVVWRPTTERPWICLDWVVKGLELATRRRKGAKGYRPLQGPPISVLRRRITTCCS